LNIYDHGGDIYARNGKILDFSININPLGMPEEVKRAAAAAVNNCVSYPDHSCRRLRKAIAERCGADTDNIICGNGASDLIYRLFAALRPPQTLLAAPTFSEYEKAALSSDGAVRYYPLHEATYFDISEDILDCLTEDVKLLFLCSPNNPTGRLIKPETLGLIMTECRRRDIFFALDECFLEISEGWGNSLAKYIRGNDKLFILRAFTKDYAMPGLRLGYGFCSDAQLLDKMKRAGQPWSVSIPAEAAGIAACRESEHLDRSRAFIRSERVKLTFGLSSLGLKVIESETNFVLIRAPGMPDLKERMLKYGILIRSNTGFHGLTEDWYRVAVRTEEENLTLLNSLRKELKERNI
jgi:threonine-phosphate decarboxylase